MYLHTIEKEEIKFIILATNLILAFADGEGDYEAVEYLEENLDIEITGTIFDTFFSKFGISLPKAKRLMIVVKAFKLEDELKRAFTGLQDKETMTNITTFIQSLLCVPLESKELLLLVANTCKNMLTSVPMFTLGYNEIKNEIGLDGKAVKIILFEAAIMACWDKDYSENELALIKILSDILNISDQARESILEKALAFANTNADTYDFFED